MRQGWLPHLLLLGACFCWGINPVVGKLLNQSLHPIALSTLRWLTAVVILIPIAYRQKQMDFGEIWRHRKLFFFTALSGVTLFQTCTYIAVQFTSPTNTMLINTATPILISCFSYFFKKESLYPLQILGMTSATIGVFWVLSKGNVEIFLSLDFNKGDLIMAAAVVAWAAYSMLSKELLQRFPLLTTITITSAVGLILLFPAFVWTLIDSPPTSITWITVSGIIYLAVTASVLAFLWWNYGINALGTNIASMYLYLVPVITAVVSAILLREPISSHQVFGGILVVCGVYLTTKKRNRLSGMNIHTEEKALKHSTNT